MNQTKKTQKDTTHASGNEKRVLEAALELFAVKGYTQTSVDSIAAKAKTSKGLIYYYFKSKESILKAIFVAMLKESERMFEGQDTLPPQKLLKQVISSSFNFIQHKTNLFRLILALMAQPDVIKGLSKELEHFRKIWMAELVKAFKAMGYKNPEMEVYFLYSLFDGMGLAYIALNNYPIEDLQRFVEAKYNL